VLNLTAAFRAAPGFSVLSEAPAGMKTAWAMFLVVASLLLLFLGVVGAIGFARRYRRSAERPPDRPAAAEVDPWEESARRTEPYPRHKRKR
jgi:hypothetical protein